MSSQLTRDAPHSSARSAALVAVARTCKRLVSVVKASNPGRSIGRLIIALRYRTGVLAFRIWTDWTGVALPLPGTVVREACNRSVDTVASFLRRALWRLRIRPGMPNGSAVGEWRRLVAHLVWDQGVASSNLVSPSITVFRARSEALSLALTELYIFHTLSASEHSRGWSCSKPSLLPDNWFEHLLH
jgi:hypothetical protein